MDDTILYNDYINASPDDKIWIPLQKDEHNIFNKLVEDVKVSFKTGTKKEKGDSLENLMTFIYKRFKHIRIYHNVRTSDNQIDHIIEFIDGVTPAFINENIGLRLIGESKNHSKSISTREVADLDELLRSKKSKLGIFSSFKSFSKGKTMWINAEGKRRKLALWHQYNRIIIGFTIDELASLIENNFYTMLKQKYYQIIDELEDDTTEDQELPYQLRLFNSLTELKQSGIIDSNTFQTGRILIEEKYGKLEV
ncbi:hypothetical protein [Ornithinibacillus bavariensis]|uniref:hypothetical protein n=1 Tax=Ornithinibacillus bavariensis TaxID=545502 RepID=UPI000EDEFDC8|nr:hypothetical protein [Ornithinibacillus sp.]